MWFNHPFSQRNKTTKRTVGTDVGGNKLGVTGQKFKKLVEVGNIGFAGKGGHIIRWLRTLLPTISKWYTLKNINKLQNISLFSIPTCLMLLS